MYYYVHFDMGYLHKTGSLRSFFFLAKTDTCIFRSWLMERMLKSFTNVTNTSITHKKLKKGYKIYKFCFHYTRKYIF